MVTRQQLYCCARAPFNETKQIFDSNGISQNWIILAACIISFSASQNGHFYDRKKGDISLLIHKMIIRRTGKNGVDFCSLTITIPMPIHTIIIMSNRDDVMTSNALALQYFEADTG
jgi:hypothetical protein